MKKRKPFLCVLFLSGFGIAVLQAQATISASGGNVTSSGGSVSYTIGQILYNTVSGTNGTVVQGVQQPYEISVPTAINKSDEINLECTVYPNPNRGILKLVIGTKDFKELRFRLFDSNGILLQDKKIESDETIILMDSLPASTYFLNVLSGKSEIKTFKIIKN